MWFALIGAFEVFENLRQLVTTEKIYFLIQRSTFLQRNEAVAYCYLIHGRYAIIHKARFNEFELASI